MAAARHNHVRGELGYYHIQFLRFLVGHGGTAARDDLPPSTNQITDARAKCRTLGFVAREGSGWRITESGREALVRATARPKQEAVGVRS